MVRDGYQKLIGYLIIPLLSSCAQQVDSKIVQDDRTFSDSDFFPNPDDLYPAPPLGKVPTYPCEIGLSCGENTREPFFLGPVSKASDAFIKLYKGEELPYDQTFWIQAVDRADDPGMGSEANPFNAVAGDLDPLMYRITMEWFRSAKYPRTKVILKKGSFYTRGRPWEGRPNPNFWVLPSNWTLEGSGRHESIIHLHPDVMLPIPPANKGAQIQMISGHTPATGYGRAHHQLVRNLRINGGFSDYIKAFKNEGKYLTMQGIIIYGDYSGIEDVRLENFGTNLYESFPATVAGAHMREFEAGTEFGPGWITDCVYEGAVDPLNNGQITVFGVAGASNKNHDDPSRIDYFRRGGLIARNRVVVDLASNGQGGESNMVQGYSFYRVNGGLLINNETVNAAIGYYTDWWHQKNIVIRNNRFLNAANGVVLHTDQFPIFHEELHKIFDNIITLEPIRDGARAGIRIRRASFGAESWNYYGDGPVDRKITDMDIRGNLILYSRKLSDSENYKAAMLLQEIDGLTLNDNITDSRFLFGYYMVPVERKDAAGNIMASYQNRISEMKNNRYRDLSSTESYCNDSNILKQMTINQPSHLRYADTQEKARELCQEEGVDYFVDSLKLVSASQSQASYLLTCVPVLCLGLN